MVKDFERWHKQKSWIDGFKDRPPFFHEREIWFCSVGLNIGHEQDGSGKRYLRPVIVIKKLGRKTFMGLP